VTRLGIKEARAKELRFELLTSECVRYHPGSPPVHPPCLFSPSSTQQRSPGAQEHRKTGTQELA